MLQVIMIKGKHQLTQDIAYIYWMHHPNHHRTGIPTYFICLICSATASGIAENDEVVAVVAVAISWVSQRFAFGSIAF